MKPGICVFHADLAGEARWREAWDSLCVWECTEPHRLREAILAVLADAPRSGSPGKVTAEQVAQILAVACESPQLSGRPITRCTHRELRDEVIQRKIVASLSVAQVGRYLQQAALQPHRSKMWLNTMEKNSDRFEREAATVCQTYHEAPRKAAVDGTYTVSVDEATSLQALERNAPDKLAQPGSVTKQEFEYTRHGTTTLTAGLNVEESKATFLYLNVICANRVRRLLKHSSPVTHRKGVVEP